VETASSETDSPELLERPVAQTLRGAETRKQREMLEHDDGANYVDWSIPP
jgi:hypothetical protein